MEKNIFADGEIVHTLTIPKKVRRLDFLKKNWGEQALADYVAKFFGDRIKRCVVPSGSHNGSLTGTQIVTKKGDTEITFMMVEPRGEYRDEVHISKMVSDLKEGGILDVIDYKYGDKNVKEVFNSPFATLGNLISE